MKECSNWLQRNFPLLPSFPAKFPASSKFSREITLMTYYRMQSPIGPGGEGSLPCVFRGNVRGWITQNYTALIVWQVKKIILRVYIAYKCMKGVYLLHSKNFGIVARIWIKINLKSIFNFNFLFRKREFYRRCKRGITNIIKCKNCEAQN